MLTLKYICMSVKICFIQQGPTFLFQTSDSSKHPSCEGHRTTADESHQIWIPDQQNLSLSRRD